MEQQKLEASFSTLVLSVASSAAMSLGLAPNPSTGNTEIDKEMAKFNIDLLEVLQTKTENNLTDEEEKFLKQLLSDLKMKYVAVK
ncbi:MAG: DUF1844 domain-containing protein [Bdellovibrionales bacterium]|nr:DUF1844 domain-containing protein [Bdellovibrionales bacterium]